LSSAPKWSWSGSKAGTINIYDVWYDLGEGKLYIDVECIKAPDAVYGGLNGAEFALFDKEVNRGVLLNGVGLGRATWSKSVSAGDLDYYYWLVVIANLYEWGTRLNAITIKTSEIRRVGVALPAVAPPPAEVVTVAEVVAPPAEVSAPAEAPVEAPPAPTLAKPKPSLGEVALGLGLLVGGVALAYALSKRVR
jgi:hypothetical protein